MKIPQSTSHSVTRAKNFLNHSQLLHYTSDACNKKSCSQTIYQVTEKAHYTKWIGRNIKWFLLTILRRSPLMQARARKRVQSHLLSSSHLGIDGYFLVRIHLLSCSAQRPPERCSSWALMMVSTLRWSILVPRCVVGCTWSIWATIFTRADW